MLHFHKKNYRIGLDIDDVCCKFLDGYSKYTQGKYSDFKHFYFSYKTNHILPDIAEDFWMNLEPVFDPTKLNFLPTCYISTRSFDKTVTQRWLEKNNFPCMPVIHVGHNNSKVNACRDMKIDVFIDDFLKNFEELNAAGIETFLFDCCHNRQYDVGTYRIFDLNEVPKKLTDLGI